MSDSPNTADDFLTISPRIRVMPIIHGSGDFAIQVREELLNRPYDCVAVPLAPFVPGRSRGGRRPVAGDLGRRPGRRRYRATTSTERELGFSYVPIDPCQGVIAALADGARRADRACVHRPGDAAVRAGHRFFSGPLCTQASQTRAFRGGAPGGDSAARCPARTPSASPGWRPGCASWKRAIARSSSSARSSTGPGSAMRTSAGWNRREPESFFAPIATYAVDPRTLDLRAGRAAVYHRAVRARPPRADARRQPVGRRRQGDGARCAGAAQEEASQDRPADHAAASFGLFSLHPQPVADRPAADARPLHADRRGPANGRRRLCPGAGRDGPIVPVSTLAETIAADSSGFEEPGLAADGDQSGGAARLGHRADGQPAAGTGALVADLRAAAPPAEGRANPVAPALEPVRHVLVAARGRPDRELPSPRSRPGQGDPGRRPGAHREVHDERARRHRHPRDPAELAYGRSVRQGRAAQPRARSRSWSSCSTSRPTPRSTSTARPGTPSTPRNRPWPSTPPIP